MTTNSSQAHLVIVAGLPGSGKSTETQRLLQKYPDARVVNRDDLRTQVAGEKYHSGQPDRKVESKVTVLADEILKEGFRTGGTVISDNTNLNARHLGALVAMAQNYGATVEVVQVDVSVAEAKKRNAARGAAGGRLVPNFVIDAMAKKSYSDDGRMKQIVVGAGQVFFVDRDSEGRRLLDAYNSELAQSYPVLGKDVALVDIDGTLAFNAEAVDRFIQVGPNEKKNWMGFYEASENAPVNASVLALTQKLRDAGLTVIALTGRQDSNAKETIGFLRRAGAPISRVLMARGGDFRGDYAVKTSELRSLEAEGLRVVHSVDDRPSSIRVWEENGISVSRVAHHSARPDDGVYREPQVEDLTEWGYCVACSTELVSESVIHSICRSN